MRRRYDFGKAKRGPVIPGPPGKTRITIRIDDDVLDWFRKQAHEAGGGNYQTMMNYALRTFMESEAEPLEETLRRVLLEVLPQSKTQKLAAGKAARKKAARKKATRRR